MTIMCANCGNTVEVARPPRREQACSHRCTRKLRTLLQRPEAPRARLGLRANRRAKMRDPLKLARREARRRAARERAIERVWAQRQAVA